MLPNLVKFKLLASINVLQAGYVVSIGNLGGLVNWSLVCMST
jgi:hypothetical protein